LSLPAYAEKSINLLCNYTTLSTSISGDAEKLRQVILNTLSNALTYTNQGDVVISVDTTEHWAEIILFSNNPFTIERYESVAEELEITLHTFNQTDQLQRYLHLFGRKTSILILDINSENRQHINRIEQMCFPLSSLSIAVIVAEHPFDNSEQVNLSQYIQWLQIPASINSITLTQLIHDVTQTSINQKMVRVQIIDTGVGIPNNQLNKIFSKFHQHNDTPNKNTAKGIGVGLTISQEIVERHRGRIWVESECGNGSKFTVLLPLTL
jgi:signal transduction histidine kinase